MGNEANNLLPCPFCGQAWAALVKSEGESGDEYVVECQTIGCGARSGGFFTAGNAVEVWNNRAQSEAQP